MKRSLLFSIFIISLVGLIAAAPQTGAAQEQPTKPPVEVPTKEPVQQPTKEPVAPPPTKEPVESPPTKTPVDSGPQPTKTALPVVVPTKTPLPVVLPTKTGLSTVLPTLTPLPTVSPTIAHEAASGVPTHVTVTAVNNTRASHETGVSPSRPDEITPAALLTGVVFDDTNDNGQRDPDEAGLPGVAVRVESAQGVQTLVTDASGVYSASALSDATVRVIVPAGWNTRQLASRTLSQSGDFPLRANRSSASDHVTITTPLTVTQTVLDFAPLLTLGVGLAVVIALGFLRTSHAISSSNRQLALLLVRMQRTSEKPMVLETAASDRATDEKVLGLLNQAGLDATGQPLQIERVLHVAANPRPSILALGHTRQHTAFMIFTPLDQAAYRRSLNDRDALQEVNFDQATAYPLDRLSESLAGAQRFTIDALNSGLFVADDLAAAYTYLAEELPVAVRTLPRMSRWTLLVTPLPSTYLNVQLSWRYRLRRALAKSRGLRRVA